MQLNDPARFRVGISIAGALTPICAAFLRGELTTSSPLLASSGQKVTTERIPSTAASPIRLFDAIGFGIPPPGLKMYWKSGWTCHQPAS
jgi:hypothetical protein